MSNFEYGTKIPPNTYVVLNIEDPGLYADYVQHYENALGTKNGGLVLCLGEISNMPNHYICVNDTTKQIVGNFHCDIFRPATDEDL